MFFPRYCLILFWGIAAGTMGLQNLHARSEKIVGPGVTHFQEAAAGPLHFNVLKVDLGDPRVTVEAESGSDRLWVGETVAQSSRREAEPGKTEIIGGVNADFWSNSPRTYTPSGFLVSDGMIFKMPSKNRSVFALTEDEKPYFGTVTLEVTLTGEGGEFPIDRINIGRAAESAMLYTPPYGTEVGPAEGTARYIVELPDAKFLPNRPVQISLKEVDSGTSTPLGLDYLLLSVPAARKSALQKIGLGELKLLASLPEIEGVVASVVGGGPRLMRGGQVTVESAQEGREKDFVTTRHPRTAVGVAGDGKTLFLVTVDGRQPKISIGQGLHDLAEYMRNLGCSDAINLDGGGSTTMVVRDKVVNNPSDLRGPRSVTNSLLVVGTVGSGKLPQLDAPPRAKPVLAPANLR